MHTEDITNKSIIPIVFCFNDDFIIPAKVCIYSLILNTDLATSYIIHVFYSNTRLGSKNKEAILKLAENRNNIEIKFIDVKDSYSNLYETGNFTIETYFRLAIPEILKMYPKVIYFDSDIIFTGNITKLFHTEIKNYFLGVIKDELAKKNKNFQSYIKKLNLSPSEYFNGGVVIFNNDLINREGGIQNKINNIINNHYLCVDQDILNIAFKNKVKFISNIYNFTPTQESHCPSQIPQIIHYASVKPWKQPCSLGDIWWTIYRQAPFYDENYYLQNSFKIHKNMDKHIKAGTTLEKFGIYKIILFINKLILYFKK